MNQIGEASKRISALLAGAKQYSQMDRARVPERRRPRTAAQHRDDVRRQDRQGQCGQTGQGPGQVAARIAVLPRRSQPGLDQHHRQRDPGDGRQRHADVAHDARERRDDSRRDLRRRARHPRGHHREASSTRSSPPSRSARAPDSVWIWPAGSSSKSTTATCACSPSPDTPSSSSCCRWRRPHPRHRHRPSFRPPRNSRTAPRVDRTMTDEKPNLGRFGSFGRGVTPEQAKDIEALGYGAVWVGGSPPAELDWVEPILETDHHAAGGHRHRQHLDRGRRTRLRVVPPHRQGLSRPLPAGHRRRPPRGAPASTASPIDALNEYLDKLDEYGVPKNRRVVAALGPQVLKLSAAPSAPGRTPI